MSDPLRTVDALGTWCPVPIALLRRAVARAAPGEILELLADDPLVAVDLPAWCHDSGNVLEHMTDVGGVWRARVRVATNPALASRAPGQ